MPFTYLGLPLGTTRPTIADLSPLADQVERRRNACSRLLDYGGRLTLVQSVLSSLPTHYMATLKLPKGFIAKFDRARRHCLWAKSEGATTAHSLAAWPLVCRPKMKGGLGITNLEVQNNALLLKYLHKFFSHANTPWVTLVWSLYGPGAPQAQAPRGSFWWKDIFKLTDIYRSISRTTVGNGQDVLFWKDFWLDGILLCERLPHLYSFALEEDINVADMFHAQSLSAGFALQLSVQAYEEYEQIENVIQRLNLTDQYDSRSFIWGSNSYTSAKFYNFMFDHLSCDPCIVSIWKWESSSQTKGFPVASVS